MRSLRAAMAGACTPLLALGFMAVAAPVAHAEPCDSGLLGSGSGSGLLGSGSFGTGSSGPRTGSSGSGSGGAAPEGPQGPLPALGSGATRTVAWVTGPRSPNRTYDRFSVSGTDLGIMWDNGAEGDDRRILMAFGDTFGNCSLPDQQWRHNILMRTADDDLSDGIDVPDPVPGDPRAGSPVSPAAPALSRELVGSLGVDGVEITVIPTAGIAVDGVQYVNFMSVRSWGDHGEWWTNASMIASSRDNGETWQLDPATARINLPLDVPAVQQLSTGNENFQQHAYVRHEGYVYDFGTPQGRFGPAFVSRVPETALLDLVAYEYWSGDGWIPGDAAAAAPVVPPAVGEMSVQLLGDEFVMLYGNEERGTIEMRTSPRPEGPWSEPRVLVTHRQIGGLYAPFIHPWSTESDLYFTASRWSDYNVMLLHTTLS
ncbi:DUF4185 domain-containing protein [Rhodococcus sp. B50]|uniref:DUF4185 domain-containing protein n=1 Tax=Rhodococcus sp. B50 TaxID=2682847 RepID=UPI001BD5E147|nr:DUF4185 domain-containing protein [Rhodococcus sp. B50]MBS9374197.1 hypothetical protein [Rhodococcus sp. B50]